MTPEPLDPAAAFAELARIRLGETDLAGVLDRVSHLAVRSLPGASDVSVTLIREGAARTAAHTGRPALEIDEWQYRQGRGPCLDAAGTGTTIAVPEVAAERRWPGWSDEAMGRGVLSTLSAGLPIHESVTGCLNIYGTKPHAFDEEAIELAETFAGYAGVCLANAQLYETSMVFARNLEKALTSRAVIEQAKGIVMGQRNCDADEAFAVLARASQDANRKLRDVAADLVARAQRKR